MGKGSEADFARQRIVQLEAIFRKLSPASFVLSIGVSRLGIEAIAVSYSSARRTLQVGLRRHSGARLHSYYELSLPVLLSIVAGLV